MNSSHLGWTLATASGAVFALNLVQIAWQSAPTSEALVSGRSQATPISSHMLTPTGTYASQDRPVDRLSRSAETSIEAPRTAAVPFTLASTSRTTADAEWVPLAPAPPKRDPIHVGSGEDREHREAPRGQVPPSVPGAPARGIHVRVDPAIPGNTLIVGDQRATVEGVIASRDPDEAEIQVSIEKDPASGDSETARQKRPLRAGGWGLSYEEELFRTKWGWAAFAEVQRIATQEAGSSR